MFVRTAEDDDAEDDDDDEDEDEEALSANCRPDILLLDLGLPDMDGLEVIHRLRAWSAAPIIISVRGQESDKVAALDAGADDYLTEPFGAPELMARIRAAQVHPHRSRHRLPVPALAAQPVPAAARFAARRRALYNQGASASGFQPAGGR